MRKILISCLSNSWGGLEMVAYEMAIEFQNHGFEVLFLCYDKSVVNKKMTGKIKEIALLKESDHLFLKIFRLRKILNHFKPEKMIINRLPSLKYVTPALSGAKSVELFCISHMLVNYYKKDPIHYLLYRRIKRMIVLTEYQKKNHLEYLPILKEKIHVIPDWISTSEAPEGERVDFKKLFSKDFKNFPIMLMASRLDPQKGQELAIKALEISVKMNRPFCLIIIGENTLGEKDMKTQLEKLVEKNKLTDYVRFLGHVDNIFPYLRSADAVLVPSYEETFGRVIIESMHSGTPVIASRSGGIPDLIKDQVDGILHEKKNAVDLELKIYQFFRDAKLKMKIREKALMKSQQYSKDLIFKQIEQLVFHTSEN